MNTETPTAPARIHELLRDWVDRQPEAPAVRDDVVALNYAELSHHSVAMAERLARAGVGAGDRVLLVGENCVALCVLILAISRLDAWSSTVNARLSKREITQFIEHSGARRVVYLSHVSDDAAAHAAAHRASPFDTPVGHMALSPSNADAAAEACFESAAKQVAALVYTSGTTGAPKAVMLTHANLLHVAAAARDMRHLARGDVLYGVLPMAHVVGLSTQFLGTLASGAALLLAPRFSAEATLRALAHEGITVFTGVPALFARILEWARQHAATVDAPSLRLISVAGSPLTPTLKSEVEQAFGLSLQNGYGLTETSPTVAQTRHDVPQSDCSVGRPIPGVQVRIVGEDGVDVAAGAVGELWVRGPTVMKGYYRSPEVTATVIDADGWFNTGDMASCDERGDLFISGRTKELIIRSGFNVYPLEVEQVLNGFPGVVQSAVVGREVGHNEEVVAFLEVKEGMAIDAAALQDHLRAHLSPYKVPSETRCMATLPSAPNGKIQKHVLRELAKTPALAHRGADGQTGSAPLP